MDHNNILGTVLAGGKSQRFGEDKSQVKLDGKLLIDYILTEIIDQFKEVLIVSNSEIKFENSKNISVIGDLKLGQPEPESYFWIDEKSLAPQHLQT